MTHSPSRRNVIAALGAAAAASYVPAAFAQKYPDRKPIRLIVPYAAGGSLDAMARELGTRLATVLGQTVLIENKPGASTMIGSQQVARSEPDGYTLLVASSSFVTAPMVYRKPLHKIEEFAPITQFGFDNHLIVVNPSVLPVNNLAELIARAKANPGKITCGTAGTGTSPHLEAEEFQQMAGIKLLHVPFNGSAPGLTNLVGGQIDMMFDAFTSAGPHIRAGKVRALAVTGANRLAELPDVPTVSESGMPQYVRGAWDGLFAPAGTPPDVIARLHSAVTEIIKDPQLKQTWARRGLETVQSTPQEFQRFLQQQVSITGKLVKDLSLQLE
ncbi:Bug family tripartite tricarboxylate transporter substrate binding protein [Hydrogenophaga sp. BPS33]|uniref:Bug family tripartite tricarboxylate transporter substrate binding protein n=1 Tax=Hydrogenophaga sp. BPS33 TaxID=2651974 RepID=UPI0013202EAD|nr:tripartite tricarboxylate transporter substrate binding protein [Hydrogenophaga sp. BPS33]QHE84782.1 tripartite tricarboxylate transporter substrate binding protein [Hydrogenophaga sp. BPS33]